MESAVDVPSPGVPKDSGTALSPGCLEPPPQEQRTGKEEASEDTLGHSFAFPSFLSHLPQEAL